MLSCRLSCLCLDSHRSAMKFPLAYAQSLARALPVSLGGPIAECVVVGGSCPLPSLGTGAVGRPDGPL